MVFYIGEPLRSRSRGECISIIRFDCDISKLAHPHQVMRGHSADTNLLAIFTIQLSMQQTLVVS
ncbi:hypothetical protein AG1IA_06424 [Rhizoctonia solani AG-1 IA]|uniref:Uncharacterized protein n=1 Tax=Thanatephorus cucumeris (strain AG1-IA) TaxID=983506 RepID=L8WT31_THACA|nr:hypothetical protein AG1IA_06424 [Rhizoctonia solani AG-1 IA]